VKLVTVTTNLNVLSDVDKSYKGVLWNIIDDYRAKFIANFKGRKAKDIKLLNRDDWTPNLQIPNLSSLYSLPLQVKFLKDLDFSDTSVFEKGHNGRRKALEGTNQKYERDVLMVNAGYINPIRNFQSEDQRQEYESLSSQLVRKKIKNDEQM